MAIEEGSGRVQPAGPHRRAQLGQASAVLLEAPAPLDLQPEADLPAEAERLIEAGSNPLPGHSLHGRPRLRQIGGTIDGQDSRHWRWVV